MSVLEKGELFTVLERVWRWNNWWIVDCNIEVEITC